MGSEGPATDLVSGVLELRTYVDSGSRQVTWLTRAEAVAILDRLAWLENQQPSGVTRVSDVTK